MFRHVYTSLYKENRYKCRGGAEGWETYRERVRAESKSRFTGAWQRLDDEDEDDDDLLLYIRRYISLPPATMLQVNRFNVL